MKRFLFSLETLLRHRRNLEEKERAQLSRLFAKFKSEVAHLQSLQAKHHETLTELAQKRVDGSEHDEALLFYPYLDRLRHEMRRSEKRIAQLEQELEAQKTAVIEAKKKKRVLETLRTKKLKQFNAALDKEEQKAIDEIVVTRFAHKAP